MSTSNKIAAAIWNLGAQHRTARYVAVISTPVVAGLFFGPLGVLAGLAASGFIVLENW